MYDPHATSSTFSATVTQYGGYRQALDGSPSLNDGFGPSQIATAAKNAPISTLTDDFTTADTAKWTFFSGASVTGGQLVLPADTTFNSDVVSKAPYDLADSAAAVEFVQRPTLGAGTTRAFFDLRDSLSGSISNGLVWVLEGANLNGYYYVTGTQNFAASVAYSATTHRWLRISQTGGLVSWDTSPDGNTWTSQGTWTPTIPTGALYVELLAGDYGTEPVPGSAIFDNLNVTPPPPTPVTVTDAGIGSDAVTVTAQVPTTDTASGADVVAVAAAVSFTDTGTAADAAVIASAVPVPDTAGGTDAITVKASTPLADTGTPADALTVASAIALADTGTGTDALVVTVSTPLADSAAAAESVIIKASVPVNDAGAGADALLVAAANNPALPDIGTVTEAVTVQAAAPLVETGTVTESFAVSVSVSLPDAATSIDAAAVAVSVGISDAVTAAESFTLAAAVTLADAAAVVDAVSYTVAQPARDITLAISAGRSRGLTAAAGVSRTLAGTGRSRDTDVTAEQSRHLSATGRSRTLTATPQE